MPTAAPMSSSLPSPTARTAGTAPVTSSTGARLVTPDGRELVLRSAKLSAVAGAGLCRVRLEQRWHNPFDEALRVEYQLPLPADGAVAGYSFEIQGRRTVAEIARKQAAREAFEAAVMQGHSAALLEQDRSSLFRQELGNIPAGEEMIVCVEVDQPLVWNPSVGSGGWEWRFPTVVAPRYLGVEGRTEDATRVQVDIVDPAAPSRGPVVHLALRIEDELTGAPASPSHALAGKATELHLDGEGGARLDRDVVVRWPVASAKVGASLGTHRPPAAHAEAASAFGLLTLVPPSTDALGPSHHRDLCVLFDVSGSMAGEPLDQAKRVVRALIEQMDEDDQLEMIAFSWRPERWKRAPVRMTRRGRRAAHRWLDALGAGGATEMRSGIIEALRPLRADAQRQVIIVSDGLIGFESEIVDEIRRTLPANSRVHTLGVGHGVNRSLTRPAARAGGGVEMIVAPGEDVEPLIGKLLARTAAPQLVELELEGDALVDRAIARVPDLFAGAPVSIPLRLRPEGGELRVRAKGPHTSWSHTIVVTALEQGHGSAQLATLYARERVEDLELARASGDDVRAVDAQIASLGLQFGIATRMTSWIAVDESEDAGVDASEPTRSITVPHVLAAGLSAEGVGLRGAAMAFGGAPGGMPAAAAAPMAMSAGARMSPPAPAKPKGRAKAKRSRGGLGRLFDGARDGARADADDEGAVFEQTFELDALREELASEAPEPPRDEPTSLRLWVAQVLLERDGTLVLSFELPEAIEWDPEAELELRDTEGWPLHATLDADKSTAAASLPAGLTLRIVLDVDPTAAAAQTLRVGTIQFQLRRG